MTASRRDEMFIERKLQRLTCSGGAELGRGRLFGERNNALLWSASRGIQSFVYKHSAPPEPACYSACPERSHIYDRHRGRSRGPSLSHTNRRSARGTPASTRLFRKAWAGELQDFL